MVLIRVLALIILADAHLERKPQGFIRHEEMCQNVTEEPYFEEELVIGPLWRVYYAWNMMMGNQCMDLAFKKASKAIIMRFQEEMHTFMSENKPYWSNATLVMTMNISREMLLIPDDDFPKIGRYLGVPNIHRGDYLGAKLGEVTMYKIAVKLFNDGRYLLVGDCENGVVSFLVRRDQRHTWGEITNVVSAFDLKFQDRGYPACKFNMRKKLKRVMSSDD